jgi:hypothetical protein
MAGSLVVAVGGVLHGTVAVADPTALAAERVAAAAAVDVGADTAAGAGAAEVEVRPAKAAVHVAAAEVVDMVEAVADGEDEAAGMGKVAEVGVVEGASHHTHHLHSHTASGSAPDLCKVVVGEVHASQQQQQCPKVHSEAHLVAA